MHSEASALLCDHFVVLRVWREVPGTTLGESRLVISARVSHGTEKWEIFDEAYSYRLRRGTRSRACDTGAERADNDTADDINDVANSVHDNADNDTAARNAIDNSADNDVTAVADNKHLHTTASGILERYARARHGQSNDADGTA